MSSSYLSSITPYEYFYDGQQRRFLEQIVRAFSGFQYQTGMQGGNPPQTVMVPCHMAMTSAMVATIKDNGTENAANVCPIITIWQTGLNGRVTDLQNPAFIDHRQVFEREIIDGQYGPNIGNTYNVDRIMPLPFTMNVQVDLWTSNLDQKYQLLEQICTAMWPQFEIQNSDNALDWTAITICFVEDEIEFSSRTIPIGAASSNDNLDIATIRLRLPIYLTAPAKVRKMIRIEQVVTNVVEEGGPLRNVSQTYITTPHDNFISISGNQITLLNSSGGATLTNGSVPSWNDLFNYYGMFTPGVSELRLYLSSDIEGPFVSGTIQYGSEPNLVIWNIDSDTLPANTLLPVDAVIDPLKTYPGQILPVPIDGIRYLLISDVGNSAAWGSLRASTNDIIQYSAMMSQWNVVFNSKMLPESQYVLNLHTGRQLSWNGAEWIMSIDNFYAPGYWRISL
jgi:hypothetical protein